MSGISAGDELPTLQLPPISRTTLALYAGASGDHNPIHIDIDFARRAGMPDVFAHGMLSMAYLGRLISNWAPQSQLRSFRVRFTGITHLGAAPTCKGRVLSIDEASGERRATIEVQAITQYGEAKVVGEAIVAI